jgi:type I restriction enzyme S subunit
MTEILWETPKTWAWAGIDEVGEVVSGATPSTKVSEYWGNDVIWFSPADLTGYRAKFIAKGAKSISLKGLSNSSARVFPAGSVMFSSRAPVGYVAINMHEASTNQGFKTLVPNAGVFNEYVYYYFKAIRHIAEQRATGTTFKELSGSAFSALPIVLPPTNEQRRIVEKIEAMFERIDKGVENLRGAKATLALYRQSLLKSAFEGKLTADWRAQNADKLETPKTLLARIQKEREAHYKSSLDTWQTALAEWRADGEVGRKPSKPSRPAAIDPQHISDDAKPDLPPAWGSLRLGGLNIAVSDGPFGSNLKTSDYTTTGIQVVRLENIGYGQFITGKQTFVSQAKYETIAGHTIYPGTIVVSSFVTDAVRSCVVPASVPIAVNKADCFAVVLEGERTSREFLAYYLQCGQVFKQLESLIHGVGRPRINTTQLKELHFPVCSPAEQAEITRILDTRLTAADRMEADIDAALSRADALRQSILKRAFSGNLVPQDPTDEPALTLLARIKAERAKAGKTKPRKTAHAG